MKIPLMILSKERAKPITHKLRGFSGGIVSIFPNLRINLIEIETKIDADEYVALSFLSAFLYSLGMFSIIFVLLYVLGAVMESILTLAAISSLIIFALLFLLFLFYPGILAGKKAEQIEKDLIFALKDMLLEINSGATVYKALVEVSRADYGQVSKEFGRVARRVDTGTPIDDALEELALKTTSEHFRNSIWQIVNALKAGSDIENALRELVKDLTQEQRSKIRNYAQELNVLILLYMVFAVVIPTILTTLLIVVGPFMGLQLGPEVFYIILPVSFFIQIALVEFIKSRRPVVHL